MMTIEKRLKEVEASIKVIAKYVKDTTEKMEKDLEEVREETGEPLNAPDFSQEFDKVHRRIDDIAEKPESDHRLHDRIEKLEEDVRVKTDKNVDHLEEHFRKSIRDLSSDFDDFRSEVGPKVEYMEKRTEKMKHRMDKAIEEVDFNELKKKMERVEKKMSESLALSKELEDVEKTMSKMKGLAHKLKDFDADTYREEFERHMKQIKEELGTEESRDVTGLKKTIGHLKNLTEEDMKRLAELGEALEDKFHDVGSLKYNLGKLKNLEKEDFDKLEQMAKHFKHVRDSDMKKVSELAEALEGDRHDIDGIKRKLGHLNNLAEDDMKKMNEVMEEVKDKFHDVGSLKYAIGKLKNLEKEDVGKLNEIVDHLKKIEHHDVEKLGDVLDELRGTEIHDVKKLSETLKDLKELESHDVNSLGKKLDEIRNVKTEEIEKIGHAVSSLKGLEKKDINRLTEATEHLKRIEARDVKKLSELAEEMRDTEMHDVKKLRDAINDFKKVEHHDVKRLTEELTAMKEALDNETVNRVSMEKRFKSMEDELAKFENVEAEAIETLNKMELRDVHRIKQDLDEESARRISMEKRMAELEEQIEEGETPKDTGALAGRIQDIEKNMKMVSMKMLTQQLNEFAKMMDKRIPNIVSKEQYKREIADLRQRIKTVETPDLAPLGARVDRLEKKIEEAVGMMKGMYNRIPYVVE